METTLYEETSGREPVSLKKLKSSMTLDFNSQTSKQAKLSGLLGSPDLNLLKLASPELERMIISQNGLVTTTPTPTQFLFPRSVTEEQDNFARGFVDALAQLHKSQGNTDSDISTNELPLLKQNQESGGCSDDITPSRPNNECVYLTDTKGKLYGCGIKDTQSSVRPIEITPMTNDLQSTKNHSLISITGYGDILNSRSVHMKEEPQTVPSISNTPPMSPLQPIDMECQEVIKTERKRARNRVAARKCRTRKLERIGRLEQRVNELKGQNSELCHTASQLREQVCALKKQIMTHVNSGCHVMLSPNLL